MSGLVTYAGKKILNDKIVEQYTPVDPYYDHVQYETKDGKKAYKQVKRQLPQGISKNDEKILKKVRRKAWCLDLLFSLCGLRCGWTAIIGLIPFVGLIINAWLATRLIRAAEKIDGGLPSSLRSKMMFNVAIDSGLQLIPIVGDIAGAVYKSNSRNYIYLEEYLRKKTQANPNSANVGGGGVMDGSRHIPPEQLRKPEPAAAQGKGRSGAPPASVPGTSATTSGVTSATVGATAGSTGTGSGRSRGNSKGQVAGTYE